MTSAILLYLSLFHSGKYVLRLNINVAAQSCPLETSAVWMRGCSLWKGKGVLQMRTSKFVENYGVTARTRRSGEFKVVLNEERESIFAILCGHRLWIVTYATTRFFFTVWELILLIEILRYVAEIGAVSFYTIWRNTASVLKGLGFQFWNV